MRIAQRQSTIYVKYRRQLPEQLLVFLETCEGRHDADEKGRRVVLDTRFAGVQTVYRNIAPGLWFLKISQEYYRDTDFAFRESNSELFYELEYILTGQNDILQEDAGGSFFLHNQAVFTNSACTRTWKIRKNSPFTAYKFIFTKSFLRSFFYLEDPQFAATAIQPVIQLRQASYHRSILEEEHELLRQLDELLRHQELQFLTELSARTFSLQLFHKFFYLQLNSPFSYEHMSDERGMFAAAISLMKQNLEVFPGIGVLAASCNMSEPTFKRKFKTYLSQTPENYFRSLQMELATTLLQRPDTTVKEVASVLGYVNLQSFTKAFKKVKGFPPSAIKK